ncbi:hypothetical protein B296_00013935 [Ensete ventricosum]|uniref:Uncharacterized protein n=1 Tax=Ensete ventricosum TaxID=4639 RepID=A0A426ZY69_ENSVE|nr:hypothetical protein B296_00013935 [Ensete ventricosum]
MERPGGIMDEGVHMLDENKGKLVGLVLDFLLLARRLPKMHATGTWKMHEISRVVLFPVGSPAAAVMDHEARSSGVYGYARRASVPTSNAMIQISERSVLRPKCRNYPRGRHLCRKAKSRISRRDPNSFLRPMVLPRRNRLGSLQAHARTIPGPFGFFSALSGSAAHRVLAGLANSHKAIVLMAFSVGFTRFAVSSHPDSAKEILHSSAFADRPIKESAYELLFHRAMGFSPFGEYWRNLRRISSTHLFSPRRVAALGERRRAIGEQMVTDVRDLMAKNGVVEVNKVLHFGSLNNVTTSIFGRRYDFGKGEGLELQGLVKEGYELLGLFNWADHFPPLGWLDLQGVRKRCRSMSKRTTANFCMLMGVEEMIFRGTDTVAILLEWVMARPVLHPDAQSKARSEIDAAVGNSRLVTDADIVSLPYLQAIVKESLRMHPPGPLLSWARIAVHDAHVGSHFIPAGTTAMVNMWAITHDESIWAEPDEFKPERFTEEDVNILGSDLRLAPFGAGRRVWSGKAMGLATVHLWLARLLHSFNWVPADGGVDLSERLRMSLEMEKPLVCRAVPRC